MADTGNYTCLLPFGSKGIYVKVLAKLQPSVNAQAQLDSLPPGPTIGIAILIVVIAVTAFYVDRKYYNKRGDEGKVVPVDIATI